ncbi:MAG: 3-isopropylmalate dehydratase large subunit [Gammaproteobacteria bacterium]|mgnify:CR=1 FL=1|nr:3-isopropylmalate dehydratase large subunit [Gammaproteobacteria bacterium]MBT4493920.1 3-isopropylmalate dehydratase large subunit [Gammaproteobacteria bacterium]
MGRNLFQKVWDDHVVRQLDSGQYQVFVALHMIHEVTSPQAFGMLKDKGLKVAYPERTCATVDHIIPTDDQSRPLSDEMAEKMIQVLSDATEESGIEYFAPQSGSQGIVHVVGPELGLTQPGMTICCGDSHTATHGAFGCIALGIGTSQVRDVLASQTLAMDPLKVRRIDVEGELPPGVTAKDVILHIIRLLGVNGGVGYAYEYAGSAIDNMSMEERMTVCNMSIEGGARCGYINPDETTFEYLKGKEKVPAGSDFDEAVERWKSYASDADADYDDIVTIQAADLRPTVTWGVTPAQAITIEERVPSPDEVDGLEKNLITDALDYMQLEADAPIKGTRIDVAFIGSCTNGRLSDFEAVAEVIAGKKVADNVRAIAVPGSEKVDKAARAAGLDKVFAEAGFEWRLPGCSMCLAMNPDKLVGSEICASSSNRNFIGRQGSPTGRTILMSPVMVAAAAIEGRVADAREVFELTGAAS